MSNRSVGAEAASTPADFFDFTLNGENVRVTGAATTTTLLDWLRRSGRTGSKQGCAEGDCGACTVAMIERNAAGEATYRAFNSCIALLPSLAGREILTVEGLSQNEKLHPVQTAMVDHFGSQCGYCTPGFVVSLFEAYYRKDVNSQARINDQLCGNLCRCTGYRPIRDAAAAVLAAQKNTDDIFAKRLLRGPKQICPLAYATGDEKFFRPNSLVELFALRQAHPQSRLIAGATEIGVEVTKKLSKFPVLISTEAVPELVRIQKMDTEWRLGAGATLTAIEEAIGGEFPSLAKLWTAFASRQIRNRATLGGNLATASPIGDSAPVLLTLDASVVLAGPTGSRTVALADFFTGYRQTVLGANEIILEILIPRAGPAVGSTRRADFQKISHRRELDISIVAGAFRVDLDAGGVVREARLAFGGVAVRTLRARKAEAALLGKKLEQSLPEISEILRGEFTPIDDVRGSATFRRGAVVSLWEKFALGSESVASDAEVTYACSNPWPISETSKNLRHESAVGHVTGGAQYTDDVAQRRPMLETWLVLAPHARAKVTRRDATKARAFPGIIAVLMAEDVPGHNNVGVARQDEPLFAEQEIFYHGQIVAAVIGDSIAACRAAAALVEVDYEPLAPVTTIGGAMAAQQFHTSPHVLTRGDVPAALAGAPLRIDGEFSFGGQEHFYLETQACWAEAGDDGDVFVMSSTQHPSDIQTTVAEVLHLPRNKVVVQSPRMGGGFGGKETQGNTPAAIVALAALKTKRPVRVQFDRDVDMAVTGKRHPFYSKFAVGFDRDGMLLVVDAVLVSNGGWSLDLSQPVLDRALFHIDNSYYVPALRAKGLIAKTNVASNTAFRGFGGPQGMIVIEEIIDRVARHLGKPAEEIRRKNLYRGSGESNTTHFGEDIGDNRLQKIWSSVLKNSDFAARSEKIVGWNRAHARIKRGIAVTPVKFGISFTLTYYNQAGALVLAYQDGTVQVNHGGTEMGQGLHTKILGLAMRELGLPASAIRLMKTTTDKIPNTSATAASAGADLNGAAVRDACVKLRERLAVVAARLLGTSEDRVEFANAGVNEIGRVEPRVTFADLCRLAHVERVNLSASGFYKTPDIHWDWETMKGRPFAYFACGAAVAEVELDGDTGMHRVLRVDIVHDVGDSLNPGIDRGQIEGGFVQGMGWLTCEDLKWDPKGRLLTHSASTYQIPAISDAPMEFNVTLLPDAAQPGTIHGSKAVGEPPLMLAFCVREALREAVAAFGKGLGLVSLASPATSEALFLAVQEQRAPALR